MSVQWEEYNKAFLTDGIRFLCGKFLGSGISREVFVYGGNPDYVVKVEVMTSDRFQNVMEYQLYQECKGIKWAEKWLAPCARISPHGNFMIQERTMPVLLAELEKKHPKIPVWLTDCKVDNWGKLGNGKIVCHDYGVNIVLGNGLSQKMHKADWWD